MNGTDPAATGPIVGNETKRELMTTKSDSAVRRCLTALPVYNEARHIPDVLAEVRRYSSDILVVDDGSTDNTPTVLAGESNVLVVKHERNLGYGGALRTAFDFATRNAYDVLVTIDCDGQHQPRLIPELAAAVFPPGERPVDVVSGSRYLRSLDGNSVPPEERRRINAAITQLVNDRLGLDLTDAFCGFKAYRVAALKKIEYYRAGVRDAASVLGASGRPRAADCRVSRPSGLSRRKSLVRRVARRRPASLGILSDGA